MAPLKCSGSDFSLLATSIIRSATALVTDDMCIKVLDNLLALAVTTAGHPCSESPWKRLPARTGSGADTALEWTTGYCS